MSLAIGMGIGMPFGEILAFNPIAALFGAGEQGGLWNIALMSSLFQDSAGTTPVTAVEQPVGLVIDQSEGGLSSLGSEIIVNGNNENALYTGASAVNGAIARAAAPGGGFAAQVTASGGNVPHHALSPALAANKAYVFSVRVYIPTGSIATARIFDAIDGSWQGATTTLKDQWVTLTGIRPAGKATEFQLGIGDLAAANINGLVFYIDDLSVKEIYGNHLIQATSASRPTYSARYNLLAATATLSTQTITVGAGSHTIYFTSGGSVTLSGVGSGTFSAGTNTFTTTAGSLTVTVSGSVLTADIRRTIDTVGQPAYQRVTTSTDYDTTGFYPYLRCDGADDGMYSSASIDFTVTDAVTVFAGATKLSDAAESLLVELGIDPGSNAFVLSSPFSSSNAGVRWLSRGSSAAQVISSPVVAPISFIATGVGDISADVSTLRLNGSQAGTSVVDQGTGNYSTAVLYLGRRGNNTIPFNGRIYSLIVRGALTSGTLLTNTERWIAQRMPSNLIA